jgi:hydrogenase maturation protein HypF
MGRLFDAVASMLGIRQYNSFDGECAIALEAAAQRALDKGIPPYPLLFDLKKEGDLLILDHFPLLTDLSQAVKSGRSAESLSLGFHFAIAEGILNVCKNIREYAIINQTALSGGVFQNRILLEKTAELLTADRFIVLFNQQVPPSDAGIALGQAYIASRI